MNMTARENEATQTHVNGVQVTLRPLNAAVIRQQAVPRYPTPEVADLVTSNKPAPYKVGPQDVLLITIWDHPELTMPLGQYRTDATTGTVVDEDGYIYYPYIGRLFVAGQTVPELRNSLTKALDKVLRNPQLDVKIMNYRAHKIYVGGEVRNPAVYPVTDVPFNLAEAVNRAGGFMPTADMSRIEIARGKQRWTVSFLDLVNNGNLINQVMLKDGDSVFVRHREESPVYMLGELRNPRSLPLYSGRLSLAQALSDAGGIDNNSADPRCIYVLRQGPTDNSVDVFHLDAGSPAALVIADRFALKSRDIVYVDAGTLTRWNRVMNMLLPTINSVTGTAGTAFEIKYLYRNGR